MKDIEILQQKEGYQACQTQLRELHLDKIE